MQIGSKHIVQLVLNNFQNDSRVLKEAKTLHDNGYDVQVVALHEFPLPEIEVISGISVHRIKLKSRSWSKHKVVQFFKYFEFIVRVIKGYRKFGIFHCNDLSALPIGVFIKLFFNRKAKVVYDAHEYETEINGLKGVEKKAMAWLEYQLIRYADKVITVSDSIANEYQRLYNIQKPALVLNTPPFSEVKKQDFFRKELDIRQDQTIFLYQGGLSRGRGIELLVQTFSLMRTDKNVIVFMGYGPLEGEVSQASDQYATVFFRQAVSPDILLDYTASADYGISLIEDVCLSYRYCLPNKIFEYLMAGIPVLCSNLVEMHRFVERYKVGVIAVENSVDGVLDAVNRSLSMDYQKIKSNIIKIRHLYNWEEQEKVLLGVYDDL